MTHDESFIYLLSLQYHGSWTIGRLQNILTSNILRGFDLPKSPWLLITFMLCFLKMWKLYTDNKNYYKIDPRGLCPNNHLWKISPSHVMTMGQWGILSLIEKLVFISRISLGAHFFTRCLYLKGTSMSSIISLV